MSRYNERKRGEPAYYWDRYNGPCFRGHLREEEVLAAWECYVNKPYDLCYVHLFARTTFCTCGDHDFHVELVGSPGRGRYPVTLVAGRASRDSHEILSWQSWQSGAIQGAEERCSVNVVETAASPCPS